MIRTLLVLGCVAFVLLLVLGVRLGWRNRLKRQAVLPALPEAPDELGAALLAPLVGLYVGTTYATSWQDRVVHAGLGRRASASASLYEAGVLIDRVGEESVFISTEQITGARLAAGLAGKVMGQGGLLVISWTLGQDELDTGLRADDKTVYPEWVRAIDMEVTA